jgi:hydroxyacylglutathione hydrolase
MEAVMRIFVSAFLLLFVFTPELLTQNYEVLHQVTGFMNTNSYLVYDKSSKEAALVDPAGSIDTLMNFIADKHLKLKYILVTHSHQDHVFGIPEVIKKYPEALVCITKQDYNDRIIFTNWEEEFTPELVEKINSSADAYEMFSFDYDTMGEPGIFLKDNDTLSLGEIAITTIISPGHSRGSVCYKMENILFPGDVLMYRRTGSSILPKTSSTEDLVKSVRRLYNLCKDETIVYPGHGRFTDIGSEKVHNSKVRMHSENPE